MTTTFGNELRADLAELFTELGQAMTLTEPPSGFDKVTGAPTGSETVHAGVVFTPFVPVESRDSVENPDQKLKQSQTMAEGAQLTTLGLTPDRGWRITDPNGEVWTVVSADPINPDELPAAWEFVVEQAGGPPEVA